MAVERAVEVLSAARRILVFTGAGLSTESGIPDFRGPGRAVDEESIPTTSTSTAT